jgi:hypothetical protein
MVTDIPTSLQGIFAGRLDAQTYLRTLRDFKIESVFNSSDILPSLAEIALIPYLAVKRGY